MDAAITRAIRLKETIIVFTSRYQSESCPRFTKETFRALEDVLPALDVFRKLTMRYSTVECNIYKVLPDMHVAIQQLTHMRDDVSHARKPSFQLAIDKLTKYIKKMLANNWMCAAFALDANVKEAGLFKIFEFYQMPTRADEVVAWIRERLASYQRDMSDSEGELPLSREREVSPNPFAASQQSEESRASCHSSNDAWEEYNNSCGHDLNLSRKANETVLQYWKRQESSNRKLEGLCNVARDVLGLSASSTSIERLLSQSGNVLGRKRGSLSPSMLLRQTALKVWSKAGILQESQIIVVS